MKVETLLEQEHLEGDEITLHTSTPSDLRLVLQDSVTNDALREGYISLFEQVNTELNLTPIEVFHAVHFLEYATIHIRHHGNDRKYFITTIFPEEEECPTKLTSALIKLICHPSDKLRAAALSFFDVGIWNSRESIHIAVSKTGLLPRLFEILKPHEIPINKTTIEFHRHITSIVDHFFRSSSWNHLRLLGVKKYSSLTEKETSEFINPLFAPICAYFQHLVTPPACPTDFHYGLSLFSNMNIYKEIFLYFHDAFPHPELEQFFNQLRKTMKEELASLLDLSPTSEALHQLLFGDLGETDELHWAKIFASILVQLSEGRPCSDLGLHAILLIMSHRPLGSKLLCRKDGTFSLQVDGTTDFSLELPSNTLRALIPTRLHCASAFLAEYKQLMRLDDDEALARDLKSGWFSNLFGSLTPSNLPFTNELFSLHTQLIRVMEHYLNKIRKYEASTEPDPSRSEPDELYHSFHKHTKDYLIHLSLHPFAMISKYNANTILDFFANLFGQDFENSVTTPFRDEVRKEMDEAALSSSSPPFLLTSEFVCRLTDDEIMNVVDRIVALLESDSPLDDDTILRICAFIKTKLKSVYLPELFRKAGRTMEQYFHALNTLLSLPFDYFDLCPINSLLTPKPNTLLPTFDEWDEVDLSTVGVVLPTIDESRFSFKSSSSQLLHFAADVLPRLSHYVSRLTLPQLERLLIPSVNVLFKFTFLHDSTDWKDVLKRRAMFRRMSRLCNYPMIAQCLRRFGLFSRIVDGLLDDRTFIACVRFFDIFLNQAQKTKKQGTDRKALQRTVPLFLEAGLQDVLDSLFVNGKKKILEAKKNIRNMGMNCLEAYLRVDSESDDTDWCYPLRRQ
ncbi:hypothetical protein BLNAU_14765 [Blattamonas nauphoetae]|uniref:Uncharacterized protein n=1 Tax=Blattamonas nauphoetae TaxID=2049346 RepID=A0ABQ9XCQ8_9EUKA|nr:hypothetical protein BLNAU_14765 [Blattamonas nauphoetae]